MRALPRRAFLRGTGGLVLGLPWLESLAPRRAGAGDAAVPKRLVLWFTPNGTVRPSWTPGPDFTLSPILAPLADHREALLVASGIDMLSSGGDRKGHNRGVGCLWTGIEPIGGNDGETSYGNGISVDQHIAAALPATTPFRTLEFGVQVKSTLPNGRMIYGGPSQPIAPEDSPHAMFDRIFADFGGDPAAAMALRARRKSVLDAVAGDLERVTPRLGAADRAKLDAHLGAVRALELRLDQLGVADCVPPEIGPPLEYKKNPNYPAVGALQMDMLVLALACGLTNVASIMWSSALGSAIFTWLGQDVDHHSLSHDESEAAQAQLVAVNTWYAERFAELLARMKAVPEGDGTLLDHSVVVWGSELGKGQPHDCRKIPFVLAGGCHGYFATGRHVAYDGASHNDLLLTLCEALDVSTPTFGDPAFCHGPLPELRA
ncbi:MAG TPA: DUF1552 domain-containing protein [Nannocystaceae bacterium]|nr:DUF1552 domain-containing protein [Nannocystaceae bacterium]